MTGGDFGRPFGPPPLGAPPGPLAADEAVLDLVDQRVLAQLQDARLYQAGGKRIVRGRVPGGVDRRRAVERSLGGLPVDFFFEQVGDETYLTVSRPKSRALPEGWPVNVLLFLLTVVTTTWAGAYWNGVDPLAAATAPGGGLAGFLAAMRAGLPFALSLLAILTCHEFGHFFAARHYGLDTTLPYYIPIPPFVSPIGTLGAVIKMRTPLYNRRILMDVGAAGPLAGAVVALPILIYGILHAPIAPEVAGPSYVFNEPLLFKALERWLRPDIPPHGDIVATSTVLAGWIGLFVTALNLLPVGQLDGGHVVYALLGRGQHVVGLVTVLALAAMGWLWNGWWMWVLLILFLVRIKHPPVLDLDLPLDRRHKLIGWITIALFLLCIHPVPFAVRP
jgi:membrane-associated protease RseP (regulator of RpoE activity)